MNKPVIIETIDTSEKDRGYIAAQENWSYDPVTQTSDLLMMGESHPTTMSSTSGFISDDETNADDEGTD